MRVPPSIRLTIVVLVGATLAFAGTAAAGSERHRAVTRPRPRAVSLLYVVNAHRGTLISQRGRRGRFTLTLAGVAPSAVWFSDRPLRRSGTLPSSAMAADWAGFGFAKDPPNAAVDYTDPARGGRTVILELARPRYDARRHALSMAARILNPRIATRGDLAGHARRADRTPPRALIDPALFIDDTIAPVLAGCIMEPGLDCVGLPIGDTNLSAMNLSGIDLADSQLLHDNLNGANLSDADLTNTTFPDTTLVGTNLSGANLYRDDLTGVNLASDELTGATLTYANLTRANLSGAQLNRVIWEEGTADDADFTGADLAGADLVGTWAVGANFTDANLTGASLALTNFNGATFCQTTMANGSVDNSGC